jgi:PKD-like domain
MKHYLHHLHPLQPAGSGMLNGAPGASPLPGLARHRTHRPGLSSWPLLLLLLLLVLTLFGAPGVRAQAFGGKISFCEPNPPVQTYSISAVAGATSYVWSIITSGNSTNARIINLEGPSAPALKAFAFPSPLNLLSLQNQSR